jgi:hypothetical protein
VSCDGLITNGMSWVGFFYIVGGNRLIPMGLDGFNFRGSSHIQVNTIICFHEMQLISSIKTDIIVYWN